MRGRFKPPFEENRPSSVISANVTKHSEKPDIVYRDIERMFPKNKYLELFARKRRKGWARKIGVEFTNEPIIFNIDADSIPKPDVLEAAGTH